jgi:hypothetical protein
MYNGRLTRTPSPSIVRNPKTMKAADRKAAEEAAMKGPWNDFETFAEWRNSRTAIQKVQVAVANLEPGNNSRQLRYVLVVSEKGRCTISTACSYLGTFVLLSQRAWCLSNCAGVEVPRVEKRSRGPNHIPNSSSLPDFPRSSPTFAPTVEWRRFSA